VSLAVEGDVARLEPHALDTMLVDHPLQRALKRLHSLAPKNVTHVQPIVTHFLARSNG
jgi:hypothetical protein